MIPVLSRKSALFLVLGVFALLFGMIKTASAAECRSYDSSNPAYPGNPDPYWQGAGNPSIDNCTIKYDDPVGGSNLTVCQYRVLSNGTETLGWTNATGTCNENSAMLSIDISIGSGLNCRDNGENKCVVEFKAQDNAGNSAASPPPVVTLDINYNTAPTISDIANQTINEDANTGALAFTIGDAETAASSLTLTKDSSNTALIPTANIVFGGSGANRTVTVTPAENLSGSATITVTVSDGSLTASDTFVLAVTAVNDAPSFTKGANQTVLEDAGAQTVTGWATSISSGPANESGQAVDFIVSNNNNALFSAQPAIAANGTLTYTPTPNANGSATVTVQIHDNGGTANSGVDTSASQTFAITVTAVNDAPTLNAIADPAAINEDAGSQIVNLSGISAGGGESQALTITATSATTSVIPNPTVTYASPNTTGSLSYTPVFNASGSSVITVTVRDAGLDETAGNADDGITTRTFTVNVTAVNDAPTASNGTLTTNEDTAGTGTLAASDVDGNPLTYSIVTNGAKGTATITNASTGAYIYDPNDNQNGTDSFTFKVNDGTADSNTATVSVTITAVNDAPVAVGESYSMYEGATLTRNAAAGVLANDTDVEGSILTAITVSIPTNGSLILNSNGSLVYTPIANFNGTDSFTYKANDGTADSNTATVTITVSDGTAPTVTSFTINGTSCSGSNCNNQVVVNSTFTIAWTASESGGSYLSNAKIYNAVFVTGSCDNNNKSGCSWNQVGSTQFAPAGSNSWSSSTTDNPVDNTYWYGIHIADNAENCIDEDTGDTDKGHCWGVTSDSLDNTRTDRGPIKVKMQHNSSPTIQGNVGISPAPPVKAGVALTFSVDWNDQDAGEQVKIHICKDVLSVSGASCNTQGSWCASSSFTTSDPATCTYTTLATDGGTKTYNAYACDDEDACSGAKSGTFLVDVTAPVISTFSATPVPPAWINSSSPDATVSWSVSDSGGANLKQIEIWRAWDANGNGVLDTTPTSEWSNPGNGQSNPLCTKTGGPPKCTNDQNFDTASTDSDFYVDANLLASSVYWYGLHAVDKADNMGTESTPLKVQVDKNEPNSQIQSPASSSWFSNDFTLDTLDEDLLSGLDTTQCQYKIIPFEDTNGDGIADTERTSSGWLPRTCNAPPGAPVTTITVGSTDYCKYQAKSSCWVYVRSKDVAGNLHTPTQPASSIKLYNIDWTQPQPGRLYITVNEGDQAYPIQVQLDRSDTYKVHVTDNLKVTGCSLYIDNIDQGVMTPTVPGCETDCTFTKDFTFTGTGTYHNNYATCKDAANNSKSGTSVDVEVKTLSVGLTAIPSSGSTNTLFDLVATVSGTMTGDINYKFDCTNNGTWERDITPNPTQNPYTAVDLCQYSPPNTYTAKVFVQRGVGIVEDIVDIVVSANSMPSATNLQNNNATADYCFVSAPPVILSWQFSDPEDGSSQSAYRVQIATNPGFGSPTDTCPPPQGEEGGTCSFTPPHSAQEYAPPGLAYATTYYWRVKVRDSAGDFSSSWATGPSFTTRVHRYPDTRNFTWSPDFPSAEEQVSFVDGDPFVGGATNLEWLWTFGDGGTSSGENPIHTYLGNGQYSVTLRATDNAGACQTSKPLNISLPFPEWQEISPF